jgi:hypothetical protein
MAAIAATWRLIDSKHAKFLYVCALLHIVSIISLGLCASLGCILDVIRPALRHLKGVYGTGTRFYKMQTLDEILIDENFICASPR